MNDSSFVKLNAITGLEVLGLRNMHEEGISVTHVEWNFIVPYLNQFPTNLSQYLLHGKDFPDIFPILYFI